MNSCRYAVLPLMLLLSAPPANAVNRYVRAGATGDGSSWSSAYPALPSALTRGDTYYIADGSYPRYVFDDAESGTTVIAIKKATAADHGTDAGWSSADGDGVATFSGGIEFKTSYWVFDGATGGGATSWKTGFGFKITQSSSYATIFVNGAGNISVRHVEAQGAGNGVDGGMGNDSFQVYLGNGPVTLSYAYLHSAGRCHFFHHGGAASTLTAEHVYTGEYESTASEHAELAILRSTAPFIFRWSIVTHEEGTGGFIAGDTSATTAEIYGNVFYNAQEFGQWGQENNGFIAAYSTGSAQTNWKVYNNTFINFPTYLEAFGVSGANPSGNAARNNYFYRVPNHAVGSGWTQGFEHFQDSGTATGSNATSGSGDPFVAYSSFDFHLRGATTTGLPLGTPYNVDMFGNTRGADGVWDRGAIEFSSSLPDTMPPAPPANLRSTAP